MQKFKYILLILPLLAISLLSCHAQNIKTKPVASEAAAVVDTFKAEKNKRGDAFSEMTIRTWDNKIVTTKDLIQGEPILLVLFNPSCGHCKEIALNVKSNIGMFKNANIIFLAGKPLQGQLAKFVGEMQLDKTEEIVVAGDDANVIDNIFEYNGIPQIMIYNKQHKLEHIYYSEASMLDVQSKMYGR